MSSLSNGVTLQNGKYTIIQRLGQGSFGITYLATMRTTVSGRLGNLDTYVNVTVKEFFMSALNSRSADGTSVERTNSSLVSNYKNKFAREAVNLSHLHHDNIVKVLDVFEENNTTYYVMEYLDGGNLDDLIKRNGRLTVAQTMDVTRDVCAALQYMHESHMLHLDLKPKNIMLTSGGRVKLIDFGLSKQYTEEGEPESSTTLGLGTPGYAPIEQATASYSKDGSLPVTLDIYALGATMYKMLTGKVPPVVTDIVNDGLPLQPLYDAQVPKSLIGIVSKAMALRKLDRFQSITEMTALLEKPTIDEETQFDVPITPRVKSAEETVIDDKMVVDDKKGKTASDRKPQKKRDDEKTKMVGDYKDSAKQKYSAKSYESNNPKRKKKLIIIAAVCGLLLLAGIIGIVAVSENNQKWYPTPVADYQEVIGVNGSAESCGMFVPSMILNFTNDINKGLEKAAEGGDDLAQFELGYWYYFYGDDVNFDDAVRWFTLAKEQDNLNAANFLGVCYLFGNGVNRDEEKAVELFREAAEKGNVAAQVNLGICYEYGIGIATNIREAEKWYEKAADQGIGFAERTLNEFQYRCPPKEK